MWSQKWANIQDISSPYPGKARLDVTPTMVKQVGTVGNTASN
jgi:peptidyl-dipeptidase A/DNA-directed RNA polymerase III subunit RPC1